ncbi:MAG: oligosaccharide flippase family protein [Candidatus Caldarchaeum sp.]
MDLRQVVRGSFWLSAGYVVSNFLGFVYWFLIFPIVPPSTVGKAATVIAVVSVLLSILSLGIPIGILRLLRAENTCGDASALGSYFYSSLVFLFILDATTALIFLSLGLFGKNIPLDPESIVFASVLMLLGLNGWPLVVTSLFNSTLKTEYISLTQMIAGLARIVTGIPLVYFGLGFRGIMIGYIVALLVSDILLLLFAGKILSVFGADFSTSFKAITDSIAAGVAAWIPSVLSLTSQWSSLLFLGGFVGNHGTGTYFMAYSVTIGVLAFPLNILSLMFPVLSSMSDGRKSFMGRAVRIASALMYPLLFILIAYSAIVSSFLGEAYSSASTSITILAMGFFLAPLVYGYYYYVYARGKYSDVTIIGIAENFPRQILYIILIPAFSDVGASISFSAGFISSLLFVAILSKKTAYRLYPENSLKMFLIPLPSFLFSLTLPPLIGIPLILMSSYVAYARLKLVTREDLEEISNALLSKQVLANLSPYVKPILKVLFGDQS